MAGVVFLKGKDIFLGVLGGWEKKKHVCVGSERVVKLMRMWGEFSLAFAYH